jgi:hypothetical protein
VRGVWRDRDTASTPGRSKADDDQAQQTLIPRKALSKGTKRTRQEYRSLAQLRLGSARGEALPSFKTDRWGAQGEKRSLAQDRGPAPAGEHEGSGAPLVQDRPLGSTRGAALPSFKTDRWGARGERRSPRSRPTAGERKGRSAPSHKTEVPLRLGSTRGAALPSFKTDRWGARGERRSPRSRPTAGEHEGSGAPLVQDRLVPPAWPITSSLPNAAIGRQMQFAKAPRTSGIRRPLSRRFSASSRGFVETACPGAPLAGHARVFLESHL